MKPSLATMLLVFSVSGCINGNILEEFEESRCVEYVCLANPDSADSKYMQETYGLQQLTERENNSRRVQLQGDFIIWQTDSKLVGNKHFSDLVVYRFSTDEVRFIAFGADVLYALPHLHGGAVVYTAEPKQGQLVESEEMVAWINIWNVSTSETQRLDTGLNGIKQESWDFDGDWVLVSNRGTPEGEKDAIWAYNIHDDRLVHIYTPLPNREYPNGDVEGFSSISIEEGIGYLALSKRPVGQNETDRILYRIDLDTEEREVIYEGLRSVSSVAHGPDDLLLLQMELEPALFDPSKTTNPFTFLPPYEGDTIAKPYSHNDQWIIMGNSDLNREDQLFTLWAHHIPSGESRTIMDAVEVSPGEDFAMDEDRLVVEVLRQRGKNFEAGTGRDLYWMPVDELERRWNLSEETVSLA